MRTIMAIITASALVGGGAGASAASPQGQHVRDQVVSMLQDVGAILSSFAGGPNDPKNPILNKQTLKVDEAHLNAATAKAHELAGELGTLSNDPSQTPPNDR